MELANLIIRKIKETGPISFQEFMEMCLYYPGLGYYSSGQDHIGAGGDFYTAATITPAFGIAIARQIEEMWAYLNGEAFTIVEYGAGKGDLCHAILSALKHNERMYEQLEYRIIEKGFPKKEEEEDLFDEKVTWHRDINECSVFRGCVLSNELLDNFSVHRVVMEDELKEIFVGYQDGFVEMLRPARPSLIDYLEESGVELPRGFQAEINLKANTWIAEVAHALDKGYILTIDYGYSAGELYRPCRKGGTLLGYYEHTVTDDLYRHIGRQDITSHVNFSALSHWGRKNGLSDCGFTDQCHFLLSLGIGDALEQVVSCEGNMAAAVRMISRLKYILLMDMGPKFKVLIQEKGGCSNRLLGLRASFSG